MKKHKYDLIIFLALIGFGVALYLSITHYLGYIVPCNVTHGCEVVLSSKYSMVFGLPVAVWGVAYFTAVILCALLANHYQTFRKILSVLLGFGALGALGFLFIQFFVLKKVCQYCFTTDSLNIIIFLLDLNIPNPKNLD